MTTANKILFVFFFIFIFSTTLHAQFKGTAKGRVVNTDKEGVGFAAVVVKNTSIATTTDENGYFSISNIPSSSIVLIISGVDIEKKEVAVTLQSGQDTQLGEIGVSKSALEIDEAYIIGKTTARKVEEQAYAVSVVDLGNAHSTSASMGKLLNQTSGVRIREEGGLGSGFNLSINGFTGNQVKIFMDGLPIDNFGSSFGVNNMPANMAARIEVYKGVLPANLGMDALGGAINIVTRKDANYLDASYSIGSFNTHKASVNGAYTNKKNGFTVRANAYYNYSDNDYKVYVPILDLNTNQYVDTAWVKRFHDSYQSIGAKVETGVVGKSFADNLLIGILYSNDDNDVQNGQTMKTSYGGITRSSRSIVPSLRYSKDDLFFEGLSLSFYGAYNDVEDKRTDTLARRYNWYGDWVPASSSTAGENSRTQATSTTREWLTTTNLKYSINDHHIVTLNHTFSTLERKTRDKEDLDNTLNRYPQSLDKHIVNASYMAQFDKWNATLFGKMYDLYNYSSRQIYQSTDSARIEHVSRNKNHFGYGAAATYFFMPDFQLKLSYERAYRLPQSSEIFGDGLFTQDNPDLKPEKSDNLNVGLSYGTLIAQKQYLYVETSFLYRNTTDYILKELNQSGNSNSTKNTNQGKVRTYGIEGTVRYMYRNIFHVGATITYQDITNQEKMVDLTGNFNQGWTENPNYGNRIPNTPYLFGSVDAGLKFHNALGKKTEVSLDYSMNYVHEYYLRNTGLGSKSTKDMIPEQLSHDIALGCKLDNGRYSVSLECSNFTNRKLYDNYMLQKPGRAFSLKLRYFLR